MTTHVFLNSYTFTPIISPPPTTPYALANLQLREIKSLNTNNPF